MGLGCVRGGRCRSGQCGVQGEKKEQRKGRRRGGGVTKTERYDGESEGKWEER